MTQTKEAARPTAETAPSLRAIRAAAGEAEREARDEGKEMSGVPV